MKRQQEYVDQRRYQGTVLWSNPPDTYASSLAFLLMDGVGQGVRSPNQVSELGKSLSHTSRSWQDISIELEESLRQASSGQGIDGSVAAIIQGTTFNIVTTGHASVYHFPHQGKPYEITAKEETSSEQTFVVRESALRREGIRLLDSEPTVITRGSIENTAVSKAPVELPTNPARHQLPLQVGDHYFLASARLREYIDFPELVTIVTQEGFSERAGEQIQALSKSRGAESPVPFQMVKISYATMRHRPLNPILTLGAMAATLALLTASLAVVYTKTYQAAPREIQRTFSATSTRSSRGHLSPSTPSPSCIDMDQEDTFGEKDGVVEHQEVINWAYRLAREELPSASRGDISARASDILQDEFGVSVEDLAKQRWKEFQWCKERR